MAAAALSATVSFAGTAAADLRLKGSRVSGRSLVSMGTTRRGLTSMRPLRFRVCAAKAETVGKVMEIVKQQLALGADAAAALTAESKFSELGADSLDTVEIVMALEEEFNINVEEDNAQSITTIQDAAELIDKLVGGGTATTTTPPPAAAPIVSDDTSNTTPPPPTSSATSSSDTNKVTAP
ncbi:hypothetical protein ACP4OV_008955 [Aristida adscensionis]